MTRTKKGNMVKYGKMVMENDSDLLKENNFLKAELETLKEKFERCNEEIKSLLRKTVVLLEEKVEGLNAQVKMLNERNLELDAISCN